MKVRINERGPFTVATFEVNTEAIDVTSMSGTTKPDPAWRFVDKAGHFHAYAADGSTPTLQHFTDCPCDTYDPREDCDHELQPACLICGEEIHPATITLPPDGFRKVIPGRSTWSMQLHLTSFGVLRVMPGELVSVRRGREWFSIGMFEYAEAGLSHDTVTISGSGNYPMMKP